MQTYSHLLSYIHVHMGLHSFAKRPSFQIRETQQLDFKVGYMYMYEEKEMRDMLLITAYLIEFFMIMAFAGLCIHFKRNLRKLSQ